jgi:predicted aconitase with swiveling domain
MAGSVTSVVATLIVNPVPQPPFTASQPASQTLTEGATASFSVVAGGTTPLNYQWRWGGNPLAGQTGSTLTLGNVLMAQVGGYDVVVTNSFGSVTSAVAVLTVNPAPIAPSITAQPQSLSVTQGQDAAFTVMTTGTAPLSYFWRKAAAVIAANAGSSFTIAGTVPASAGGYSVIVSNAGAGVITQPQTGVSTDAKLSLVRRDATGRVAMISACRGSTLVAGGVKMQMARPDAFVQVRLNEDGTGTVMSGKVQDLRSVEVEGKTMKLLAEASGGK